MEQSAVDGPVEYNPCDDGPLVLGAEMIFVDRDVRSNEAPAANARYSVLLDKGCVASGVTDATGRFEVRTPYPGDYCVEIEEPSTSTFYYTYMSVVSPGGRPLRWAVIRGEMTPSHQSLHASPARLLRQCRTRRDLDGP